ncbi:MAG: hypothetical protein R6X14_02710 [bacterium]
MVLSEADRREFEHLLNHILFYACEQLEFLPRPANPAAVAEMDQDDWIRIRNLLYEHPALFESFADANPYGLADEELATVRSWKHFLQGRFFVWRCLKKHTVLLDEEGNRALGVVALNKPFAEIFRDSLPAAVEMVLLPFKGRIIYDGLMASYPVVFGPGMKRMLNDAYRRAKAREGVVTSFAQLPRPMPDKTDEDDFALRYRYGFVERLPYKLDELKLVTQEHIRPDKRAEITGYIRKNQMMKFPGRMGVAEGFDPIQVEVLELVVDGERKRIEVLNRAGAMCFEKDPVQLACFHRFVYKLEETLPPGMRLL